MVAQGPSMVVVGHRLALLLVAGALGHLRQAVFTEAEATVLAEAEAILIAAEAVEVQLIKPQVPSAVRGFLVLVPQLQRKRPPAQVQSLYLSDFLSKVWMAVAEVLLLDSRVEA